MEIVGNRILWYARIKSYNFFVFNKNTYNDNFSFEQIEKYLKKLTRQQNYGNIIYIK